MLLSVLHVDQWWPKQWWPNLAKRLAVKFPEEHNYVAQPPSCFYANCWWKHTSPTFHFASMIYFEELESCQLWSRILYWSKQPQLHETQSRRKASLFSPTELCPVYCTSWRDIPGSGVRWPTLAGRFFLMGFTAWAKVRAPLSRISNTFTNTYLCMTNKPSVSLVPMFKNHCPVQWHLDFNTLMVSFNPLMCNICTPPLMHNMGQKSPSFISQVISCWLSFFVLSFKINYFLIEYSKFFKYLVPPSHGGFGVEALPSGSRGSSSVEVRSSKAAAIVATSWMESWIEAKAESSGIGSWQEIISCRMEWSWVIEWVISEWGEDGFCGLGI